MARSALDNIKCDGNSCYKKRENYANIQQVANLSNKTKYLIIKK